MVLAARCGIGSKAAAISPWVGDARATTTAGTDAAIGPR